MEERDAINLVLLDCLDDADVDEHVNDIVVHDV